MKKLSQKDIFWTDLNPGQGSEQSGERPVVVISGNTLNHNLPVCIICPLSSQIKRYSSCTLIKKSKSSGLKTDSEVITFQIRTITQTRLGKKIGTISNDELKDIIHKVGNLLLY